MVYMVGLSGYHCWMLYGVPGRAVWLTLLDIIWCIWLGCLAIIAGYYMVYLVGLSGYHCWMLYSVPGQAVWLSLLDVIWCTWLGCLAIDTCIYVDFSVLNDLSYFQ